MFEHNTGLNGKQNNACGNTDALTLSGGQTQARCSAVDESVEVRTVTVG